MSYKGLNQRIINIILELDINDIEFNKKLHSYTLELYLINKNFVKKCLNEMCIVNRDYDDYLQLAYLALYKHIRGYKNTGYSFLAYYKQWIFHYVYMYNCRMQFPLKIPVTEFKDYISLDKESEEIGTSYSMDFTDNVLTEVFWEIVESSVGKMNSDILKLRYNHDMNFAAIGRIYNIGRERVRQRVLRSIERLRKDTNIKKIADEFY